jgi:uncharacterized membrane protein YbhN (UPF0104 family)
VEAVREFYLAMFVNQVLPGGVSGDAYRAWRHGRRARQQELHGAGPAVRAVIIERVANQMVMALCILASIALWPLLPGALSVSIRVLLIAAVAVIGVAVLALALLARRNNGGAIARFFDDAREALVRRGSLPAQVGLGLLVVGCCLAMFYCAAHAVGASLSLFQLLALVPATLFAMTIPISIGGWGVREASAVALWTMAGLPAEEALASSILYGVLTLLAALPGVVVLLVDRQRQPRAPSQR